MHLKIFMVVLAVLASAALVSAATFVWTPSTWSDGQGKSVIMQDSLHRVLLVNKMSSQPVISAPALSKKKPGVSSLVAKNSRYADIKEIMGMMIASMDKFAAGMDAANDTADVVRVLSEFADSFMYFKTILTEAESRYPELMDAKDPPAELLETYESLQASSGKLLEAMIKIQDFSYDPAVIEALSKLQGI